MHSDSCHPNKIISTFVHGYNQYVVFIRDTDGWLIAWGIGKDEASALLEAKKSLNKSYKEIDMTTSHQLLNIELDKLKTINDLDVKRAYEIILTQIELEKALDDAAYQRKADELEAAYKELETYEKRQTYLAKLPMQKPQIQERPKFIMLSEISYPDGTKIIQSDHYIAGDTEAECDKNILLIQDEYKKYIDNKYNDKPTEFKERYRAIAYECLTFEDYIKSDYYKFSNREKMTKEDFHPIAGLLIKFPTKENDEEFTKIMVEKNYLKPSNSPVKDNSKNLRK